MIKVYTSASGSYAPNYAGWAFAVTKDNYALLNGIHYSACTEGTIPLMQDFAIYQALIWLQKENIKYNDVEIYGELAGTGLVKLIIALHPTLKLITTPQDDLKAFTDSKAELGRVVAQSKPISLTEVKLNDTLVKLDKLFSTRYVVTDIFSDSVLIQNLSTVSKKMEVWDGKMELRKL